MQPKTGVGISALHYRIVIREIAGIFITAAITILSGILLYFLKVEGLALFLFLIFLGVFAIQFVAVFLISNLEYGNLKYLIEQNSVSLQTGRFSTETETIPFEKIKNSSLDQSLFQRFFSVGNIIIDQDDEKFIWNSIDLATANLILEAVSSKSNIQPITISMSSPQASQPTGQK